MRRIALIGAALIASLAMTVSASARLGMAPIAAQDDSVIQVKHGRGHGHGHAGDAATITGGTGAAATTSIVTTDKPSLDSRSPFHCPGEREWQRQERVAPTGAAGSASADGAQPSSISTAIRIRSE